MKHRRMKHLVAVLVTLMLVAILPIPVAMASPLNGGEVPIEVKASKTIADVGEEIIFTVEMGSTAGKNLSGFEFCLDIPAGLTLVLTEGKMPHITEGFLAAASTDVVPGDLPEWTPGFDIKTVGGTTVYQLSCVYFEADLNAGESVAYNGASPIDIATFVCKATEAGVYTVSLKDVGFYSEPATDILANDGDVTPASVTARRQISSVNVGLPTAKDGIPVKTISGAGYSGTVSWSPADATFVTGTTYTATVSLTADTAGHNYFSTTLVPTVNGGSTGVTGISVTEGTIGFTYTVTAQGYIYGNVDDDTDGLVNTNDLLYLARHLAMWPAYSSINMEVADVNGDGLLNTNDLLYLARYLARWPAYPVLGPH